MEVTDPSHFGTLTFEEREAEESAASRDAQHTATVTRERGEWHPPERLTRYLPEGFSVPIDCVTGPDGLRRIVPRCNFEELTELGAVGGLAVIHGRDGFDEHVDYSYRAMHLIHQFVCGRAYRGTRGMQGHLTREFGHSRDLYVRRPGRLSDDERDVLPDDVGLNALGEGRRLSVTQLTELGREAAKMAGHGNPTSKQAIAFGLYEAAKLNPLEADDEQVQSLVKMALFDIESGEHAPSEELIDIVTERLLEAIYPHLENPQEAFDKWFTGPGNSIVKQIAQQKSKRGGKLCREDVRQALLQLGWRACHYLGQCVDALLRTIAGSLPDSLNEDERRLFERMHLSRQCYGDLPLALIAERSSAIRRAVLAVWEEPQNAHHEQVLHRLLAYYADMARKRRRADLQSKQRCGSGSPTTPEQPRAVGQAAEEDVAAGAKDPLPHEDRHTASDHHAGSVEFVENIHSTCSVRDDSFARVAEHIREFHGIECDDACENWDYHLDGDPSQSVTIDMRCECGRVVRKIDMPADEFAGHAETALERARAATAYGTMGAGRPPGES